VRPLNQMDYPMTRDVCLRLVGSIDSDSGFDVPVAGTAPNHGIWREELEWQAPDVGNGFVS
jgi:hypothetical protein